MIATKRSPSPGTMQERRIRSTHGLSASLAMLVATLHFGEARK